MLTLQTNLSNMKATSALSLSEDAINTSSEQLASGKRINSASDDAAGLAVSTRFKSTIGGNDASIRDMNDGISLSDVADGGLHSISQLLQRMRELSLEAQNGTYSSSDIQKIQAESDRLLQEIDHIANSTSYNGIHLLNVPPITGVGALNNTTTLFPTLNNGTTSSNPLSTSYGTSGPNFTVSTYDPSSTITWSVGLSPQGASKVPTPPLPTTVSFVYNYSDPSHFIYPGNGAPTTGTPVGSYGFHVYNGTGQTIDLNDYTLTLHYSYHSAPSTQNPNVVVHSSALASDQFSIQLSDVTTSALGISNLQISSSSSISSLDSAIDAVSKEEAKFGSYVNVLSSKVSELQTSNEVATNSNSKIEDADIAKASSENLKETIKSKISEFAYVQSNKYPQMLLQLLTNNKK